MPGAVDEVLRWVTPLNNFFRRAVVRRRGRRPGRSSAATGSCCCTRRPTATRPCSTTRSASTSAASPNPHLSFGFGTHLCIGANFARTTLAAVFGGLARRATDLRAVTEPDVEPNIFARAVRRFDLALTPR